MSRNTSPELFSQEIQACILLLGHHRLSCTDLGMMIHGGKNGKRGAPQGYALIANKIGQGLVKKGYAVKVSGEYRNYFELKPAYQNEKADYFESKLKKG